MQSSTAGHRCMGSKEPLLFSGCEWVVLTADSVALLWFITKGPVCKETAGWSTGVHFPAINIRHEINWAVLAKHAWGFDRASSTASIAFEQRSKPPLPLICSQICISSSPARRNEPRRGTPGRRVPWGQRPSNPLFSTSRPNIDAMRTYVWQMRSCVHHYSDRFRRYDWAQLRRSCRFLRRW